MRASTLASARILWEQGFVGDNQAIRLRDFEWLVNR